ncbi:MAG: crossover junction endodeoxyribonuclease RuvC [Desulfobacterales bacterium]|nr:crossover junction endodeoxyribonuclease RuvC [Desulfobacterales bacterium]MDJ0874754.1 crossover junction endodeoxyribonuclease RuvC [Desulfobacterales bacterium]MDJ0884607.1 crossover junction endodeoxyribonuclease RuvC [Desulfobacterales bacterium]
MKVIGVDPGLADTGIGIVWGQGMHVDGYAFGSITTSQSDPQARRLERIYSKLHAILRREMPDQMIVEDVFSLEKYPQSGITLGKVTGVVLLAGCHVGVAVKEIPVREAKQVLTGNGNASKRQLEKAVRHTLKHDQRIRPDHASDALGLALIGLYRQAG